MPHKCVKGIKGNSQKINMNDPEYMNVFSISNQTMQNRIIWKKKFFSFASNTNGIQGD